MENVNALRDAGYLTRDQIMKEFGISRDTLDRWEKAGMPRVAYGRKVRLYELAKVIEWMKKEAA